jgi:hypothetical protein
MCGSVHYRDTETTLSAICRVVSSELQFIAKKSIPVFIAKKSIPVITQPPYYPDLAPSEFWLFSTLKMGLKECVSQPWRTSNQTRWPNSGRFQKKPSAGASKRLLR